MHRHRALPLPILVLALLLAAAPALRAAEPPADPAMQEGFAALQANDLPRAAKAFQAAAGRAPGSAEAWFRLGLAQREMKQYDAAIQSLGTALDRGYNPALAETSLAIAYVAKGDRNDRDKAFDHLGRAIRAGVPPAVLNSHPGLASVRDDPRFKSLVAAAAKAAHPCEGEARYRAFDFWIGDWDVYATGSGGQRIGGNRIERIAGGCALLESWTGAGGDSGKSINYFDPVDGKWRQHWVGDGGEVVWYEGAFADGAMRLHGETRSANGTRQPRRATFTPRPDGSVRQFLESSSDGKAWTVAFDAVYVKKGSPPPAGG